MKVLVAGATGAIGKRLVPLLVAKRYEVVGMTHSPGKVDSLHEAGAEAVVADGLDRAAVMQTLTQTKPDAVIHQMSGLTGAGSFKKFDDEFAVTNALRTTGTDYLLDAAKQSGVRRFIAQSFGGWNYERRGSGLKTEQHPLDPTPPANQTKSMDAIRYVEEAALGAEGLEGMALRYGFFYGPGTGLSADGDIANLVLKRKLPIVGDGAGVWSFVHIEDAARATIAALEDGERGVYNVVDDEPAPIAEWLPELARILGAKRPRRIPTWLGRIAIGDVGISMMTQIRGMSNAKANRELGWQPRYKSWRDGFRTGLGNARMGPA